MLYNEKEYAIKAFKDLPFINDIDNKF